MNVYHDDNHELIQLLNEVVSTWQPWRYATPRYNLPRISASTPFTTSIGFQNYPPNTNINLVPTNSKMEQLCQIDQKSSNQSISISHLEHVELQTTPTIVKQGVTYP
jgi:hypothetical protein